MRRVTLREANQNFSSCIADVEAGEHIVVTRRGMPIAEIIPFSGKKKLSPERKAAWRDMQAIMKKGHDFGGVPPTYEERHER